MVTGFGTELVFSNWFPKATGFGLTSTMGPASIPVPLRAITLGLASASFVMFNDAESGPLAEGVNVTLRLTLPFAAIWIGRLGPENAKAGALAPEIPRAETVKVPVPVLDRVSTVA